jgi:hypothetical protein
MAERLTAPCELADMRTAVDPDELGRALVVAWRALVGSAPSRESILVLLAHSALETGHWKGCHNWNLGNVKSRAGDGRCWTFFRCNEVIGGKLVWFSPPHPQTRFRAFQSLQEGAADHLAFLRGMKRYAGAWEQVIAGDPRAFARALKAAGYFTAAERPYEDAVFAIFARYKATLKFDVSEIPNIDDDTRARTMDLLALHLREEGAELVDAEEHDDDPTDETA